MSKGGSKTIVQQPIPTREETELNKLQVELAKKQLAQIDQLQPFQRELLDLTLADLRQQMAETTALDAAIPPEQRARLAKSEFERAGRLGPIQDELLQLQLEQLRTGGAATPEQLARIRTATDTAIAAGSGDIDDATRRGIGLIADELANSRGLRLSDSPISSEAALLSREGQIQKGSLVRNLRAGEASAALNFPLAAQQIQSGINLGQQNLTSATQNFQQQLRQQAVVNRLALMGQTGQIGIGLASIGPRIQPRGGVTQTSSGGGLDLAGVGALASGVAAIAPYAIKGLGALFAASDRRLKHDIGVIARTRTGIPLHVYRYKGDPQLRLGVMADEAEEVVPEAVLTHRSGFKVVNYNDPGIGLAA